MIIAVTAPTGNVGGRVTSYLLNMKGIQVTLLTRNAEKVARFKELGAFVGEGDLEDGEFVCRTTATADVMFWVTPTPLDAADLRGFQNLLGQNAAEAVATNRIRRVVNLSSIGAHLGHGTGPIDGLHDVERHLDEAAVGSGATTTHLRPAFYMENYLQFAKPIVEQGVVPLPVSGEREVPMIATGDVAVEAVRQLAFATNGRKSSTRQLLGPRDLRFDEAARTIGEALGRPVEHVHVDPESTREAFLSQGASEDVADRMVQMYRGVEELHLRPERQRNENSSTPTEFRVFCETHLAPQIRRMQR